MQFIASDTIAHILLVDGAVRSKAEKFEPHAALYPFLNFFLNFLNPALTSD